MHDVLRQPCSFFRDVLLRGWDSQHAGGVLHVHGMQEVCKDLQSGYGAHTAGCRRVRAGERCGLWVEIARDFAVCTL